MTKPLRTSLRTSDSESPKFPFAQLGARLLHIRADRNQGVMAELLGVSPRTYVYWEAGVRELAAHAAARLYELEGWNANWLLTGAGPERLNASVAVSPVQNQSHSLSDENLTIALEFAERCVGDGWLPRPLFAKLVRLIYEGVTQGLPVAEVLKFGRRVAEAMAQGELVDDGESTMGAAGRGSPG